METMWQELGLDKESIRRNIKLQPTSAVTGMGLNDGFEWIVDIIAA